MKTEIIEKAAFSVIGRLGSTEEGEGFISRLWDEANASFGEIEPLVKKNGAGVPVGIWGAMSDFSLRYLPWEDNFSKGYYLAGAECREDAVPPEGWTKWNLPGFRYLRFECDDNNIFYSGLKYLEKNGYVLVGAVQDFTDVSTGKNYMCFPIGRL